MTIAQGGTGLAAGRARGRLAVLVHRIPFTTTVVLAIMIVGIATGSLWHAAEHQHAFHYYAYGLPSLEHGRWWTLFTGPFYALRPWFYLPMAGSFALMAGFAEWHLGTRRAMAVTIGGQLVSTVVAVQFLELSRNSGWAWADRISGTLDVGFSGGALAAIAITSATLRTPWRLRLRAALCVYAGVAIVYVGTLADLVHFFALVLALPLGRRLAGPAARNANKPSLREWRLLASAGLVLLVVAEVVMWLVPGDGPFGSSDSISLSGNELLPLCIVAVPILNGLRRGSRFAWRCAIALCVLAASQMAVLAGVVAVTQLVREDYDLSGPPLFIVDNLLWTVELVLLISARRAFRVPSRRRRRKLFRGGPDPAFARLLLGRNGGSTISWMTTWPQNTYFVASDGASYLAYQRHAGVAVALGDPVAPDGTSNQTLREFSAMCENTGLVPCVFSATAATVAQTRELGWQHVQVAEDTLVDLENLEFRGKAWQDVRTALNRAKKDGIEFRLVRLAEQPWSIREQVRALSEEWIGDKGLPEMGFTLGGVDQAMDPATRVGLAVDADGTVHGVTSWLPVHTGDGEVGGWTLDVMRRRAGGFRPVMEFLIASTCLAFREEGAKFVSLSGAPLVRSNDSTPRQMVDRMLDALGSMMEPYYGFRSLHAFKAKFQPRHEPLYLAYRDEADLPRIGIALGRAYLPNAGLMDFAKLALRRQRVVGGGVVVDRSAAGTPR
ncbi:bifunctional lysylphosphatidylglycerol flippase/synthetase MprF [Amycolatopsis silviterrae]|uniref:Bifunctional lysylphosphatidylglycerol flippase/synthetase MprF n=1 Tax=Amycolatopsis silviterrae TaxID=1656914 RepID=A0ABW5H9L3_9PSEU